MEVVYLEPLDKKDLLEILDYALEKKHNETTKYHTQAKWSDVKWWDIRIKQLKKLINGYDPHNTVFRSSYGTIQQGAKKNNIESDIEDVFNNKE